MLDSSLSGLIGRIYSETNEPNRLTSVVDDVIARCGGRSAMLAVANPLRAELAPPRFYGALGAIDEIHLYEEGLFLQDPTLAFLTANPTARTFDTSLHMRPADHAANAFIHWTLDIAGIAHWTTGYAERDVGKGFVFAVHTRDPQTHASRGLFRMLFNHFENAHALAARQPDLTHDPDATIVVDDAGRVLRVSAAAERLLAIGDGLGLYDRRLVPSGRQAIRTLDALIGSAVSAIATGGAGGAMTIERPSGRRPLAVTVDPLPAQFGLGGLGGGAIVRVVDPEDRPIEGTTDRWRALWGLTPAEARLAEALVACDCDLRAVADLRGVSYATVRTQLSGLFVKTRTRSQPELMRLLTRVPG